MQALGYREGRDIVFERSNPDIVVAHEAPAVLAARKATSGIPIVMAPGSEALAGGNVTGIVPDTREMAARLLQFLREVKSGARRVAVLANADDPSAKPFLTDLQAAATRLRVTLGATLARSAASYETAFAEWDRLRVQALVVLPNTARHRAVELAARYRIPAIGASAQFAEAGGLMSYGVSAKETARRAAGFVDRLLKGARPADLPVEKPRTFELALNLRTAKALEVEFPESLIARADALFQ